MRKTSLLSDARGLELGDHVCWRYGDAAEFRACVQGYLADGLASGERVCYVGSREPAVLAADLQGIAGIDEALRSGAAQVISIADAYPVGAVADPSAQVEKYAALTEEALSAGFTGLRAAVEATSLVEGPEQRDAFARYEHLIDQYMVGKPCTALCGYDEHRLGGDAIAELACMHPAVNERSDSVRFRLYASSRPDCAAALTGELDIATVEAFRRALEHADLQPFGGETVLDATGIEFMDHCSMLELGDYARNRGTTLVLYNDGYLLGRLAQLLDMTALRVEQPR